MDAFSAFLGFVAGIVAKIVGDLALRDILRPQLKTDFKHSDGSYVTQTFTTDSFGNPVSHCHYVSLRVANKGRTSAKNCRGFLVKMERRDASGNWIAFVEDVIQLNWAFASKSERGFGHDLLPGMHRYLNVFWVDERWPDNFLPATVTIPNRWYTQLHRKTAVRFTIQVAAEEAESEIRMLTAEWGPRWNEYMIRDHGTSDLVAHS